MQSRFVCSLAALPIAGLLLVVGFHAPAGAQEGQPGNPGQGSERCNRFDYPPSEGRGKGMSDTSVERGQRVTAWSGCSEFAPGRQVQHGVRSIYQQLGTVVASSGGEALANLTIPLNLADGQHHVIFRGTSLSGAPNEVSIPFVVAGGPGTGAEPSAEPSTGAEPSAGPGTGAEPSAGPGTGVEPSAGPGTGAEPDAGPGTGAEPSEGAPGTGVAPGGGTVKVGGVSLPRTGSDEVGPMTVLGISLVVAGASMAMIARRRRSEMLSSPA